MKKIFIASKNKGKIKEIKYSLDGLGFEFFSLLDTPDVADIAETGNTFEENAWLKAKAVYELARIPVVADDSGLEVDVLNGEPGVFSARYAGENATDNDNCSKLLSKLEEIEYEKRTAHFKCVIIYYDGFNKNVFEGKCSGHIITYQRGENGFGYDPLFMPDGYSLTFAELDPETKNTISHRGRALKLLIEYLTETSKKG
jgi:XTP/dITP diphosphohydrolase